MDEQLKNQIGQALAHSCWTVIYTLFILPWDIWVQATNRLAKYHMSESLSLKSYNSPWPLFSLLKHLILEVGIDFMIFCIYFVAVIAAFILFITLNPLQAIIVLIAAYYAPVSWVITRDTMQLCLLPVRKLLSYLYKPAQHLDVDIKEEVKE